MLTLNPRSDISTAGVASRQITAARGAAATAVMMSTTDPIGSWNAPETNKRRRMPGRGNDSIASMKISMPFITGER